MGDIILDLDELWSFVNYKINKVWIWLVIDRKTRRILACYIGDRTRKSAQKLWDSLPERYRQNATCYTDFWQAYKKVIPESQHRPVGKESGEKIILNAQIIHLDKDYLGLFVELFPSQNVSLICGALCGILSTITMHNSQIHNSITTLEFLPIQLPVINFCQSIRARGHYARLTFWFSCLPLDSQFDLFCPKRFSDFLKLRGVTNLTKSRS